MTDRSQLIKLPVIAVFDQPALLKEISWLIQDSLSKGQPGLRLHPSWFVVQGNKGQKSPSARFQFQAVATEIFSARPGPGHWLLPVRSWCSTARCRVFFKLISYFLPVDWFLDSFLHRLLPAGYFFQVKQWMQQPVF